MPTTKTAIRARVDQLDEQLSRKKATSVSQADERRQLVQDCADNGGHVPMQVWDFHPTAGMHVDHEVCQFCAVQLGTSVEQIGRNLSGVA